MCLTCQGTAKCWLVLTTKHTKTNYEYPHRRISTREWFGNREKAPARTFSWDKMRVADNLEEDFFGGGWSYGHVNE
jgi:hypothetical protein